MDERGLWKLFFKTGRPEVYLAIAARRREVPPRGAGYFLDVPRK